MSSSVLPLGTVTFLFTDIEGSTRLVRQLGSGYARVLADHERLLRGAFAEASGREVDTQGDAFFVVFQRAGDAATAAVAAQRALQRHTWPAGVAVRVRMGLHTAEPTTSGDRYVGLGVNRAARICAAAHGGQILLSRATEAVLADDIPAELELHDLGELRLKDLDGLERLFQLVAPDLPRTFPPPRCVGAGVEGPSVTRSISKRALRVVVADDTALVREGVARLLAEAGFDIVATAADADELLQQVARFEPDVAVTDIKMPPAHADEGLTAARAIRRDHPGVGVIVLSQYLDSPYALRLLEAYPERVGYLLKERVHEVAVLGDAIRRVADGECVVDPTIASRLRNRLRAREPALD